MQIVLLCSVVVVKLGIVATAAALLEMIADVATTVLEASLFMSGDFGPYNRLPGWRRQQQQQELRGLVQLLLHRDRGGGSSSRSRARIETTTADATKNIVKRGSTRVEAESKGPSRVL